MLFQLIWLNATEWMMVCATRSIRFFCSRYWLPRLSP